ncbi:MAG: ECF transporter S component [Aigarchaeota archaeon]|nr:ECF transporter S component [Candidatus Pelearchaeum maunauluense]
MQSSGGMRSKEAAMVAIMAAATTITTLLIVIPFAPTRGYFNLGDAMVMFSGLALGARLGFLAGGIGSALADILTGTFAFFAPLTLFIKGMEGFVVGLIGRGQGLPRQIAAVIAGALVMLSGYFAVELPLFGFGAALAELATVNSLQVTFGAIVSLSLITAVRKAYPTLESYSMPKSGKKEAALMGALSITVLAITVAIYSVTGLAG